MKSVLIFNPGFFIYGAERGLINLIKALGEAGFKVGVVLPAKGPLEEKIRSAYPNVSVKVFSLAVIRSSFSPFYYISHVFISAFNVFYFIFYIIFKKIDIVCSNSLILTFPVLCAAICRRKRVWFIREFFSSPLLNRLLGRYAEMFSDAIICQSEAIKKKLFLKDKAKVIYEPLDKDNYKVYDSSAAKKELNLPVSAAVIGIISRLHPSKGQYEFIRTLKSALKEHKELAVVIAGDISVNSLKTRLYKRKIKRLISKEALDNIFFLGYMDDASRIICASDICVFPFRREEPFGIAAAEALCFGRQTFFPLAGGLKEVRDIFNKGRSLDTEEIVKTALAFKGAGPVEFRVPEELSYSGYKDKLLDSFQ